MQKGELWPGQQRDLGHHNGLLSQEDNRGAQFPHDSRISEPKMYRASLWGHDISAVFPLKLADE